VEEVLIDSLEVCTETVGQCTERDYWERQQRAKLFSFDHNWNLQMKKKFFGAMPQIGYEKEHPHAGLTTHGAGTPQCHGSSCYWSCCSLLVKKVAQESNKHIITDDVRLSTCAS